MSRTQVVKTTIFTGIFLAMLAMAGIHLEMIDSKPVAETTVLIAPDTIQLWFSQDLEPVISVAKNGAPGVGHCDGRISSDGSAGGVANMSV